MAKDGYARGTSVRACHYGTRNDRGETTRYQTNRDACPSRCYFTSWPPSFFRRCPIKRRGQDRSRSTLERKRECLNACCGSFARRSSSAPPLDRGSEEKRDGVHLAISRAHRARRVSIRAATGCPPRLDHLVIRVPSRSIKTLEGVWKSLALDPPCRRRRRAGSAHAANWKRGRNAQSPPPKQQIQISWALRSSAAALSHTASSTKATGTDLTHLETARSLGRNAKHGGNPSSANT